MIRAGIHMKAEYQAWKAMRTRCANPNDVQYHRYGGRGISVAPRWDSFDNFYADMGPKPSATHSLDRIDNSKGYEPGNCRWADKLTQVRNRRPMGNTTMNGVHQYENGKFRVRIGTGYRTVYVGTADNFFDACCLRKSAENRHWSATSNPDATASTL